MNWLYLAQQISTDVVARLAAASLPPLVDGAILMGPEHIAENASPNRIVLVPMSSRFSARDASMRQGRDARAAPQGSAVLSVAVTNPGRAYTTATVTLSAPDLVGGVQATAIVQLASGSVARVLMTALGSGYTSAPTATITGDGTGATVAAILAPTAEQLAAMRARPLWTEHDLFEVHIWGCTYTASGSDWTATPNPDTDWDATATLYEVLLQSLAVLAHGVHTPGPLRWQSSAPDAPYLQTIGRYAVMDLELATPVPDVLFGSPLPGVIGSITTRLELPDGTLGTGCTD